MGVAMEHLQKLWLGAELSWSHDDQECGSACQGQQVWQPVSQALPRLVHTVLALSAWSPGKGWLGQAGAAECHLQTWPSMKLSWWELGHKEKKNSTP